MLTVRGGAWGGLCRGGVSFFLLSKFLRSGVRAAAWAMVTGHYEVERSGFGELCMLAVLHLAMEFPGVTSGRTLPHEDSRRGLSFEFPIFI